VDAVWDRIGRPARGACLGDVPDRARAAGLEPNPPALSNLLDWGRSYKSPYEIRCLEEATALGVKGHLAAREAFLAGATEVEIHHAFVTAAGCVDHELAFPSIVALDPKGATLHYRNKRRVGHGRVLLVDCGVRVRGYGSDITRTSTAPACDPRFRDLARALQAVQLKLAGLLKPGLPFPQVHHHAHAELAALLHHAGILKGDLEASLAEGLTRPFMPHGLGHFLGITIHDVAGRFTGPDGAILPPPGHYPALRTTRVLEPRQVVTVEPGLYFIPMLLEPFRQGPQRNRFDWKLIDELTPFGGIRFEDNVVITGDGARNVTRECLPEWEV
jgi:Xaa-Pro dipeptidase